MAEILWVGANDALTTTRCVILEHAGHAVTPAYGLHEVVAACKSKTVTISVLSQQLSMQEKQRISATVRQLCPSAKILELHNAIVPDLPDAHAHLRVATSQPEGLVEPVNVLTGRSDEKKPQKRSGAAQK